jgi:hypothetical protein
MTPTTRTKAAGKQARRQLPMRSRERGYGRPGKRHDHRPLVLPLQAPAQAQEGCAARAAGGRHHRPQDTGAGCQPRRSGAGRVHAANDDRKPPAAAARPSAIVTARKPGKRYVDLPEVSEEEHRRIGDLADAMMQEFKRVIAERTGRELATAALAASIHEAGRCEVG